MGTPQTFPMASRGRSRSPLGVPAKALSGGTHRARPRSTRFEPVYVLKDVTTPVPRVLLSATLAGPAPSGGAKTSRLCQGCSRPPRHHPDQAALSYTALLRQNGGEGLSPPLEQQRLTAQLDHRKESPHRDAVGVTRGHRAEPGGRGMVT
jgi:hypothetical protein